MDAWLELMKQQSAMQAMSQSGLGIGQALCFPSQQSYFAQQADPPREPSPNPVLLLIGDDE